VSKTIIFLKVAVHVSKPQVADYFLHVLVPATELPGNEGVKVHTTPLVILLLQQWGVLLLHLVPCCLKVSQSVLICHGDFYDGRLLAGFINCEGLRLE